MAAIRFLFVPEKILSGQPHPQPLGPLPGSLGQLTMRFPRRQANPELAPTRAPNAPAAIFSAVAVPVNSNIIAAGMAEEATSTAFR